MQTGSGRLAPMDDNHSPAFIGVDLGWYGKPTGLAAFRWIDRALQLADVARVEKEKHILDWIVEKTGASTAVVAVDAPIIIRNKGGIRPAERALNAVFRSFHAGCHPANLARPFAEYVLHFSRALESMGFGFNLGMPPQGLGRFQIEVHPHAASVNLFRLPKIVKYKRGRRAERAREMRRFRKLLLDRLPELEPGASKLDLPKVPNRGNTKKVEDQLDAVLCAYIAVHWWYWGAEQNTVFGDRETGFIIVPNLRSRRSRG